MNSRQIDPDRKSILNVRAFELRQLAVKRQCDVEGWRIARLLREAETEAQADEAERQWKAHLAARNDTTCPTSTAATFVVDDYAGRQRGWRAGVAAMGRRRWRSP